MKITICSSISFSEEISDAANILRALGHVVQMPHSTERGQTKEWWSHVQKTDPDEFARRRGERVRDHFTKIDWADCILVTNYEKNGVPGYIGANTLMEMGIAFFQHKPIYLLFDIPRCSSTEEIVSLAPVVIYEQFSLIV